MSLNQYSVEWYADQIIITISDSMKLQKIALYIVNVDMLSKNMINNTVVLLSALYFYKNELFDFVFVYSNNVESFIISYKHYKQLIRKLC